MVYGEQVDPFAELKRAHDQYRVYDTHYESIGMADELFVDGSDRPLYIGIKSGLLEARSVLVPLEIVRVNDKRRVIEVSGDADQVRHAPSIGDRDEITADLEARIHGYFGLPSPLTGEPEHHAASPDPIVEDRFAPDARIDIEPGERQETHERFKATPPHTGREERLGSGGEAGDAAHDPRTARARRLKR